MTLPRDPGHCRFCTPSGGVTRCAPLLVRPDPGDPDVGVDDWLKAGGFGLLDGGRGLIAALFASGGVLLFSLRIGADPALADPGRTRGRPAGGHPVLHRLHSGGGRRGVVAHTRDARRQAKTTATNLVQRQAGSGHSGRCGCRPSS